MDYTRPQPSPTAPEEHNPNPPMLYVSESPVWEYKRLSRNLKNDAPPSEADLNELGKDGWELISTVLYADIIHLYFKRSGK